jgi:hypothetical protein
MCDACHENMKNILDYHYKKKKNDSQHNASISNENKKWYHATRKNTK